LSEYFYIFPPKKVPGEPGRDGEPGERGMPGRDGQKGPDGFVRWIWDIDKAMLGFFLSQSLVPVRPATEASPARMELAECPAKRAEMVGAGFDSLSWTYINVFLY
jgi:hypothetical protein